MQDFQAAIRWLRGNAKTYGTDAGRIGVWGDSAGGHLVALLGVAGGGGAFPPVDGNLEQPHDDSYPMACGSRWPVLIFPFLLA